MRLSEGETMAGAVPAPAIAKKASVIRFEEKYPSVRAFVV